MAYLENFDATKVDPAETQQPVPAGTYLAMIIDQKDSNGDRIDDRQPTKNGNGDLAHFVFEIIDGQYKGRRVHARLNLWHSGPDTSKSEKTRKIAWGELSAICRAVNKMQPKDTIDLHNIPLEIIVGVTNPNEEGKQYNEINGYQKRGASAQSAPVNTGGDVKPSWMGA